jgi:NADPH-dependent 2,4-dienoyl-CoA reductase/sulfur reductase-like enzyme
MSEQVFIIIGGGLAGVSAAEALRSEGFEGRIRLFAGEAHAPYIRPPLSKEYLKGDAERDSIFVQKPEWYADQRVELEQGVSVRSIDTDAHTVTLADDRTESYDRLLLATGASSRHLAIDGANLDGVHYLRTVEDSERLREEIASGGKRVVIVGSGWIGLEVAAAARGYGNEVTVIGREELPLDNVLGTELGEVFAALHTANGVRLLGGASTRGFDGEDGRVTAVVTGSETIAADVVVIGVGAVPNVQLAKDAALTVDNGVLTDEALRASAADVFAAGDVANAYHPVADAHLRNEHWANAIAQGKAAAKSMLGQSVVFDEIPYFYTDQFDLGMEYSGYPTLTRDATVVLRGDVGKREFIAFWVFEGRVVAGMNVNVWDVNDDVQALIRSARTVDAARLADPTVPLAEV